MSQYLILIYADEAQWAGATPEENGQLTKEHMGWPSLEPFFVPEEALQHFRRCIERGEELESEWRGRFDAYAEAHPELAPELERGVGGARVLHVEPDEHAVRRRALEHAAEALAQQLAGQPESHRRQLDRHVRAERDWLEVHGGAFEHEGAHNR